MKPHISERQALQTQAEHLHRWILERELGASLESATTDEDSDVRFKGYDFPATEPVATGDIRLLYPTPEMFCRPVYVAVLEEKEARYTIAPFGRYTEPALPGEWQTRHVHPSLAVLCLWNTTDLSECRLRASWLADTLKKGQLRDALRVLRTCRSGGEPLPLRVAERTGPPLRHPEDPRWAYCREESRMVEAIANSSRAYPSAACEQLLAAEKQTTEDYNPSQPH